MLDSKDFKILDALKQNSRLSSQKISKLTKIPISTVHHRIRNLETSGIIKKYTLVLDEKKMSAMVAYVLVNVDYHPPDGSVINQHEMAQKISTIECVQEVSMITGTSDILIKIMVKNTDELDSFVTKQLRQFKGIEKTQTMLILNST